MLVFPVILSYYFTSVFAQEDGLSSRILYGQVADITDFPYFATLEGCSAAIISDTWLLTAASCVSEVYENRYRAYNKYHYQDEDSMYAENEQLGSVWVGGNDVDTSQEYGYDTIVMHSEYDTKKSESEKMIDVALLKLTKPLKFSESVQPVQLPQSDDENELYDAVLTVAGIERNEYLTQYNNHLMKMDVKVLDLHECLSHFTLPKRIDIYLHRREFQKAICTKRVTRYVHELPGLCYGDSGSPLVYNNILVGLGITEVKNSTESKHLCKERRVSLFTKVARYTEWIRYITGISINSNSSSTHPTEPYEISFEDNYSDKEESKESEPPMKSGTPDYEYSQ